MYCTGPSSSCFHRWNCSDHDLPSRHNHHRHHRRHPCTAGLRYDSQPSSDIPALRNQILDRWDWVLPSMAGTMAYKQWLSTGKVNMNYNFPYNDEAMSIWSEKTMPSISELSFRIVSLTWEHLIVFRREQAVRIAGFGQKSGQRLFNVALLWGSLFPYRFVFGDRLLVCRRSNVRVRIGQRREMVRYMWRQRLLCAGWQKVQGLCSTNGLGNGNFRKFVAFYVGSDAFHRYA